MGNHTRSLILQNLSFVRKLPRPEAWSFRMISADCFEYIDSTTGLGPCIIISLQIFMRIYTSIEMIRNTGFKWSSQSAELDFTDFIDRYWFQNAFL